MMMQAAPAAYSEKGPCRRSVTVANKAFFSREVAAGG